MTLDSRYLPSSSYGSCDFPSITSMALSTDMVLMVGAKSVFLRSSKAPPISKHLQSCSVLQLRNIFLDDWMNR